MWARTSRSSAMVAIVPAQRNATVQATGSTAKTHDFICSERTNQGVFPRRRFLRGRVLGLRSLPFLQDQRMLQRSAAACIHLKRCNENCRRSAILLIAGHILNKVSGISKATYKPWGWKSGCFARAAGWFQFSGNLLPAASHSKIKRFGLNLPRMPSAVRRWICPYCRS